jgi:hypothetical protein
MRGIVIAALSAVMVATGCAARSGPTDEGPRRVTFEELTRRAEAYDGRTVRVEAAYFGAFEISVLTSGFAESFPPQPVEPTIWVVATPPRECLQKAEGATWADAVRATGTFRYDPDDGFGHLGAYRMALADASLTCA